MLPKKKLFYLNKIDSFAPTLSHLLNLLKTQVEGLRSFSFSFLKAKTSSSFQQAIVLAFLQNHQHIPNFQLSLFIQEIKTEILPFFWSLFRQFKEADLDQTLYHSIYDTLEQKPLSKTNEATGKNEVLMFYFPKDDFLKKVEGAEW